MKNFWFWLDNKILKLLVYFSSINFISYWEKISFLEWKLLIVFEVVLGFVILYSSFVLVFLFFCRFVKIGFDFDIDVLFLCGFIVVMIDWIIEIVGWFVVRLGVFELFLLILRFIFVSFWWLFFEFLLFLFCKM